MFLVGGPAYSGTTLLALLLNQGRLVCLDEPDLHNPAQRHRGIPFLQELFPDRVLPSPPSGSLGYPAATRLLAECERAIAPYRLGMKTCDGPFLEYARAYKRNGYPVVCIVRDIRDALVRPLPAWLTEEKLNQRYRMIWRHAEAADAVVRYEQLVSQTRRTLERISVALGHPLRLMAAWDADRVHPHMLKAERHQLLLSGSISTDRIGVWRTAPRSFSAQTHSTARMMGYGG